MVTGLFGNRSPPRFKGFRSTDNQDTTFQLAGAEGGVVVWIARMIHKNDSQEGSP